MTIIAELECTLTKRAVRECFPIMRGEYLIGRHSKESIRGRRGYYDRLPAWTKAFIDSATYSITIGGYGNDPEDYFISRAQIWLAPGETYAKIVDLRSRNRTYVNGERVKSDDETYEMRYIYPDDTISIGAGTANLKYRLLPQAAYPHHALLVGYSEDDTEMDAIRNNVYALKSEIVRRGFAGNTLEFIGREAKKTGILKELQKLGEEMEEEAVLLFYFAGDTRGGLSRKLSLQDGQISPRELFSALRASWCQKLFILDGPYTSALSRQEMPPRSVLIGNRDEAWSGEIKSRNGDLMRYLTRAVCKALQSRQSIDIDTLVDQVRTDSLIHSVRQEVDCSSKTCIVLPGEPSLPASVR